MCEVCKQKERGEQDAQIKAESEGGESVKLIDADALKDNMFNYAAPEMVWDRGDIEHKINEMPTIDAIPVEWIKALTNHSDMFTRGAAKWVLGCWKKEQEAR
jgi:hypothetical protein